MYRFRISFCLRMMVLAGVLVFGTPAGVLAEEADHSMEGQISKPQSSGESDTEGFVDDSTDNTYGYYTIMGCTTVDAEDMVVQYEAQNVEYPSGILTEGGAPDIDTFCTIVIEEADAEGVRGEVVFEQAVEPIVDAITPVPGGVGSVTTSVLVGHVVEAAMRKAQ